MSVRPQDGLELRLERRIGAPPARVFAAWTEPEQLRRWSAPAGMTLGEGELDLRVGGRWSIEMIDPTGGRHVAFGKYLEVSPPRRVVYTHAWRLEDGDSSPETVVTVEFLAEGSGTRLLFTQTGFESEPSRDGHLGGWTSCLDQLEALLAGG